MVSPFSGGWCRPSVAAGVALQWRLRRLLRPLRPLRCLRVRPPLNLEGAIATRIFIASIPHAARCAEFKVPRDFPELNVPAALMNGAQLELGILYFIRRIYLLEASAFLKKDAVCSLLFSSGFVKPGLAKPGVVKPGVVQIESCFCRSAKRTANFSSISFFSCKFWGLSFFSIGPKRFRP